MKAPKMFICPCCQAKHSVEWAKQRALEIQATPPCFRSYGEVTFYRSAKLQYVIKEEDI